MSDRQELVWHVRGTVADTTFRVGRRERPFWVVTLSIDGGFVDLYVRSEDLRPVAERLQPGDPIEAAGRLKPRASIEEASKPIFLDPTTQLRKR